MSHGPEHHIEHAEHASHASHDDFNKRVTMSIAMVAAVLACVTMLGHRAHNDTLRLQGEAIELTTKAGIKGTSTANKWAYYQSKNMFNLLSEITVDLLNIVSFRDDANTDRKAVLQRYEENIAYYSGDKNSRSTDRSKEKAKPEPSEEKVKVAVSRLKKLENDARKAEEETDKILKEAEAKVHESHLVHEKGNRFDLGELGLQFGVVLCSLAILTRSKSFWLVGIVAAVVGLAVAMTGQFGLFIGH